MVGGVGIDRAGRGRGTAAAGRIAGILSAARTSNHLSELRDAGAASWSASPHRHWPRRRTPCCRGDPRYLVASSLRCESVNGYLRVKRGRRTFPNDGLVGNDKQDRAFDIVSKSTFQER